MICKVCHKEIAETDTSYVHRVRPQRDKSTTHEYLHWDCAFEEDKKTNEIIDKELGN